MQFIPDANLPELLLRSHEEGRVVFFCGAGISFPAGLPSFKGLVQEIYNQLREPCNDLELQAYKQEQYDRTLNLLEQRIVGGGTKVRRALAEVLKPNLEKEGVRDTHAALLKLARTRDDRLRLVTTNFDRIFEEVIKDNEDQIDIYAAPALPVPKERWEGLVYLHGVLSTPPNEKNLHNLVLTSGDFGLAYLTEGWAARFVSKLFQNYVVCFIGYGINDPILRYMMDALASDRLQGKKIPEAYAFTGFKRGKENNERIKWEAKGVIPILYEVGSKNDHSLLYKTLIEWSDTYRDGISGKESIVVKHASKYPSENTQQDDFVSSMVWALSDPSGRPAKCFAEFEPTPSLEWLLAFSEHGLQKDDLKSFDKDSSHYPFDAVPRSSLIDRPVFPEQLSRTSFGGIVQDTDWDKVMYQIASWMMRHLNDPELVYWILNNANPMCSQLIQMINMELERLDNLHSNEETEELENIRKASPNRVPGKWMRMLWRLLLGGHVKTCRDSYDFYQWMSRLNEKGLDLSLRKELRELLSPKIALDKPLHWPTEFGDFNVSDGLRKIVRWQLELAADDVHSAIRDWNGEQWKTTSSIILEDIQMLLRDALDLLRELEDADDFEYRSRFQHIVRPKHPASASRTSETIVYAASWPTAGSARRTGRCRNSETESVKCAASGMKR